MYIYVCNDGFVGSSTLSVQDLHQDIAYTWRYMYINGWFITDFKMINTTFFTGYINIHGTLDLNRFEKYLDAIAEVHINNA